MTRIQTASGRWITAAGPDPLDEALRDAEAARPSAPPAAGPRSDERPGHALLVGTGRMGSWTAFLLARFGVSLDVFDLDVVKPHNLTAGNCLFGENDIGSPKALATQRLLHRQAPGPNGYSITNPLEHELSDQECRDHPTLDAGHNIEVNSFGEPIIIMAVDPNIFFAKVRRGETELLEMTGEREQTRNKR